MRVPVSLLVLLLAATGAVACADDGGDDAPVAATGSAEAFCAELRTVVEADLTVFDPLAPVSVDETRAATARLAAAAPEEVVDEMHLLADTFAAVTEVLDEVDPADPEAAERLEALEIDQDEIAAAQQVVTGYALEVCSIDLAAINEASITVPSTAVPPTTAPPTTASPTTVPPTTVPVG